jgi:5-(carboxyamino)imidazole ribonucleotide synthase
MPPVLAHKLAAPPVQPGRGRYPSQVPPPLPDLLARRPLVSTGFPVTGVVGGGQLARMMQPAAVALGLRLRVLAESDDVCAAQVVPDAPVGDYRDEPTVAAFASSVDVLTFDHEHVPGPILRALEAQGVAVRPGAAALAHAQNKLVMRRRLSELGVPCPQWRMVHTWDDVVHAAFEFGTPVVLKTPMGGYDGKGVMIVDVLSNLAQVSGGPAVRAVPDPQALAWLTEAGPDGLLAEEKVPFVRELAVLVARSPSGQAAAWPVVQTVQENGVCREVTAPAPDLDPDLAAEATAIGLRLAGELDVTGVLAVEMFQIGGPGTNGVRPGVLVNELAMRPHNSGHWTIDGAVTSQFEQHLRAVLDLPLGDPAPRSRWSVMVNVLGGSYPDLYRSYLHVMARDPGVKVHLYGKEVRPGRKVGHVTVSGDDLADCQARARHAADFIEGAIDE